VSWPVAVFPSRQAYDRRDECILYIRVDPEWDRLRSDQRFVAIVRKVGLP
jgi:hypothetical protein